MDSDELRKGFLEYFGRQGHTVVPSASLIPRKDPTLLFTNAGMVQFKDVFLGLEKREYRRAVSSQKCMRAGGKHNDLENVGYTARHHTFFEMLGNFSFGDYFKQEAIAYGWELLTKTWGLPVDRLWITVFEDDDEAEELWKKIGVRPDRIKRMGEKDNFWAMGETGPCGPCSEILIDQGEEASGPPHNCSGAGCDCDRYLEIWNLVFMQFMRDAGGKMDPLPKPSIDTGMGLERISAVTQGVLSNYGSDVFRPIFKALSEITEYDPEQVEKLTAGRVIADHIRAITFLISDGVLPSNEGRGYILRRVIRRAARYGKEVGLDEPFLYRLSGSVIDGMAGPYPELARSRILIAQVTRGEEERFIQTLRQGMGILKDVIKKVKAGGGGTVPGDEAFRLYDTYGFPLDIAKDMARDSGLRVDEAGYHAAMDEQRERARKSWVVKEVAPYYKEASSRLGETEFVGYDRLEEEVRLIGILKNGRPVKKAVEGDEVELVLDRTPFYGESGGQVGDQGLLEHPGGLVEIRTTLKPVPGFFIHQGKVEQGEVREGETLRAVVDSAARWGARRNHTATHLLHATLREVLGEHVKQAGSLVTPDRLRFDFAHFKPLSSQELVQVETIVNDRIREDESVQTNVMGFQDAVRAGALAFFDDKYGDKVRVVRISEFSKELCGGTHCRETGQIGLFKLVQEGSVAAGVRRIEALTGEAAFKMVQRQEEELREVAGLLKVHPGEVVQKTKRVISQVREREKEIEGLKAKIAGKQTGDLLSDVREVGGARLLTKRLDDGLGPKELRSYMDNIRNKLRENFVAAVGSASGGNAALVIAVSPDLAKKFHAGEIAKKLASTIGGSGGGRPDMAQAGGKNAGRLDEALAGLDEIVGKNRNRL